MPTITIRQLRYFVALIEEGNLAAAAKKRLSTTRSFLSRQIADLEREVGTALFSSNGADVQPTAAGNAFLEHARMAVRQMEAGIGAAHRALAAKGEAFSVGFLIGEEQRWLPLVTRVMTEALQGVTLQLSFQTSTQLAEGLLQGNLDIAFLDREPGDEFTYRPLAGETYWVFLPVTHPMAGLSVIDPRDLVDQRFVGVSDRSGIQQPILDEVFHPLGLFVQPEYEVDNLTMAISSVASTGAVAILPGYVDNHLPWIVTRVALKAAPTSKVWLGYQNAFPSAHLEIFLAKLDDLLPVSRKIEGKRKLHRSFGKSP